MLSMIRQYNIYTPGAVYSAWGHNAEEALAKFKNHFPEKACSLTDDFDKQEEIDELGELLQRALPYLILLQKVRGDDGKFIAFDGDKGYIVRLNELGDLDKLVEDICGESDEDVSAVEESLREM